MVVTKKTKGQTRKACTRCGDVFNINNGFYSINANSKDDNFPDGKINVCKKCIQAAWDRPTAGFNSFIDFLRIVLKVFCKNVEIKPLTVTSPLIKQKIACHIYLRC